MEIEVRPHKQFYILAAICGLLASGFFCWVSILLIQITIEGSKISIEELVCRLIGTITITLLTVAIVVMTIFVMIALMSYQDIYGEEKMCRMQNGKVKFEIFYSNIEYLNKQFGHLIIGCKTPYRQKRKSRVFGEVYHKNDVFKICQAIRNANPSISIRQ